MNKVCTYIARSCLRAYYAYAAVLNRLMRWDRLFGRDFLVFPNVCPPIDHWEEILHHTQPHQRLLEVGCGAGRLTVFACKHASHVTALDISAPAIRNTHLNLRKQGLSNYVLVQSDGLAGVHGAYDAIVSNPPWLRVPAEAPEKAFANSASLISSLLQKAGHHMTPNGVLVIVYPKRYQHLLVTQAREHGLRLFLAEPRRTRGSLRSLIRNVLYLNIGLSPFVYVFRKC